jgi:hypothetical protein
MRANSPSFSIFIVVAGLFFLAAPAGQAQIITTYAGDGTAGYSGDGGPATGAELSLPFGSAVDGSGNLYIADYDDNVIRKVTAATGIITTYVGNGTAGYSGDGGPATSAELGHPYGVATDAAGNLYIADYFNCLVRKVTVATGVITTVAGDTTGAGTGSNCAYSGDGGPATGAQLNYPQAVAVDATGNPYLADSGNSVVRMVTVATGIITTVAGDINFGGGYFGDGGPATSAELRDPYSAICDASGNLYISDSYNHVVRKVTNACAVSMTTTTTALACSPNPALVGEGVICSVAVTAGSGTPAGTVAVRDTMLRCTITLSGGAGSCTISGFQFGQHSLYAVYTPTAGSGFVGSASPYFVETINRNATTVSLVSSLNPANVGQAVTFTAAVFHSAAASPTGTVTFKDYGVVLGTAALAGTTASFSTSSLAGDVGHVITATYNGDTNYNGSVSNSINQVVNRFVSVMGPLTCSPNPSASGANITCTGTLSGPPAGATVKFTSGPTGAAVLGTTTTGAGGAFSAGFPVSVKGTYGVIATFSGDPTYRPAAAGATHVVQ